MDGDNNGALDMSEMLQALQELGVLDGIKVSLPCPGALLIFSVKALPCVPLS